MKKEYQNGDTTVVWKPELCYHSKNCVKNLPEVFNPDNKPWIKPSNASEEALRKTIDKCPSGALSYKIDGEFPTKHQSITSIEPQANGPVLIKGKLRLKWKDGQEDLKQEVVALCRCGASSKKPFCDGTHSKIDFHAD